MKLIQAGRIKNPPLDLYLKVNPVHDFTSYPNKDVCLICEQTRVFHVENDLMIGSKGAWKKHEAYGRYLLILSGDITYD